MEPEQPKEKEIVELEADLDTAEGNQGEEEGETPTEEEARFRARIKENEDARGWVGLGRVLRDQDRLVEARQAFEKAIELDPAALPAYLGLSGVLVALDQNDKAFDILANGTSQAHKLREEGISKASLFFFLGEMQLQLQDLAEGLGFFEQASQAAPDDAEMQSKIGDALSEAGRLAESEAFYLRALELDPEPAHVYNRLGIANRRQGKFDQAIQVFLKATNFHPRDEHLLFNLARCFYDKGDFNVAMRLTTKLVEMAPDFKEAGQLLKASTKKAKAQKKLPPKTDKTELKETKAPAKDDASDDA